MSTKQTLALAGRPQLVSPSSMQDAAGFDESAFPAYSRYRQEYRERVARGYQAMRDSRVVIAGLARDLGHILPLTMKRIERLGELFADYRVVTYENDSVDDTFPLLQNWSNQNARVSVISESRSDPVNQPTRCLSRAARMAYYRSQCQSYINDNHGDFDTVILVDMDLEGGWSYDGIADTYGRQGWDFVGTYGVIFRRVWLSPNNISHYDAWAYRRDDNFTPLETHEVNRIHFVRGEPLHAVSSCFGGLGIYQMEAYQAGVYDGSDTEHVTFHRVMRKRGFTRTFLNPSQIAVYGRKHRTWDAVAARVIQLIDAMPGRPSTQWQYAKQEPSESSEPKRVAA